MSVLPNYRVLDLQFNYILADYIVSQTPKNHLDAVCYSNYLITELMLIQESSNLQRNSLGSKTLLADYCLPFSCLSG